MTGNFNDLIEVINSVAEITGKTTGNKIKFGPIEEVPLSHLLKELTDRKIDIEQSDNHYKFIYDNNRITLWSKV